MYEDEFEGLYDLGIIEPPYSFKELKNIAEYSSILQQCIDAYKTNIVGFGFQPAYTFDFNADDVSSEKKKQAEDEWVRLEEFIKYQNLDESSEIEYGYMLEDREKTGNGFLEVIRDGLNVPAEVAYMDVKYTRVCKKTIRTQVQTQIMQNGKPVTVTRWRTFRKYAQMINGKTVYFKEFGDERVMDMRTGEFDENTPETFRATEVIHFKIGSGTYGVPRWIGHLLSAYGARKAEELNYLYFKNGRHIPAAILVENGQLTDEAYKNLQDYMNDLQGSDNAHKFLLLEVDGVTEDDSLKSDGDKKSNVKVEIKSLAEMVQKDALFLEYDATHRSKFRSSFRLPPLYTGEADEYNKATADTARKITEEQVFQPERNAIAGKLNTLFLPAIEINLAKITLKGPDFRDPLEIAKVLMPFVNALAIAPNDLRDILGKVLGKTLEEFPEELYNRPVARNSQGSVTPSLLPLQKSNGSQQQNELVSILKDVRDLLEDVKNG